MKLVVEQSDIEEVKNTLKDSYGVIVDDAIASEFLEDRALASEMYAYEGLDTCGREYLGKVMVDYVMADIPCEVKGRYRWSWPLYGDSPDYKDLFDKRFKEAALARRIKLTEAWDCKLND